MRRRHPIRGDAGVGLIELVVTMAIAVVVLLAILQAADLFRTSSGDADRTADAQETARATVRAFVGELRQARVPTGAVSPLPAAGPATTNDLAFATHLADASSPTGDVEGWVRYCTATGPAGTSLIRGVLRTAAYAAPAACPQVAGSAGGWTYGVVVAGRLVTTTPPFALDSGDCIGGSSPLGAACTPLPSAVRSVGIRLEIRTTDRADRTLVLRDAVSLRNRS